MSRKRRQAKERREPPVPEDVERVLLDGPGGGRFRLILTEDRGPLVRAWRNVGPRLAREWRLGLHPQRGARGPWGLCLSPGYTPSASDPAVPAWSHKGYR